MVLNNLSVNKINFEDIFEVNKSNWSISRNSINKFKIKFKDNLLDVSLFYNLKFSNGTFYKSYSYSFRPDYTLLINSGKSFYFVHFDAKYRSEHEILGTYTRMDDFKIDEYDSVHIFKKEDIFKMHT